MTVLCLSTYHLRQMRKFPNNIIPLWQNIQINGKTQHHTNTIEKLIQVSTFSNVNSHRKWKFAYATDLQVNQLIARHGQSAKEYGLNYPGNGKSLTAKKFQDLSDPHHIIHVYIDTWPCNICNHIWLPWWVSSNYPAFPGQYIVMDSLPSINCDHLGRF